MDFKEQYKHPLWQKKRLEVLEDGLTVATPGAAVEIRAKNRSVFTDDVEF